MSSPQITAGAPESSFQTGVVSSRRAAPALEKHYSVVELAKLWSLCQRTIVQLFANEPGVLRYASAYKNKRKRVYTTLRIPESVVVRVHKKLGGEK